ncbi:acyltransferase family protein [Novosphingobium resinovorum]
MSQAHATNARRRQPVHGLDLVRFAAASLVVLYHLGFKAWALEDSSLHAVLGRHQDFPIGYALSWCGWIGVQVFFVVSGAVIAYSARGVSARGFARRRVARLLPAVLIAVAIALPVAVFVFGSAPGQAIVLTLKTLAFVPLGPWIIGQFWTIPIELAFYALVWAILASGVPERPMHALAWLLGVASASYWLTVTLGVRGAGGGLVNFCCCSMGYILRSECSARGWAAAASGYATSACRLPASLPHRCRCARPHNGRWARGSICR